jgi:hypothetical protein
MTRATRGIFSLDDCHSYAKCCPALGVDVREVWVARAERSALRERDSLRLVRLDSHLIDQVASRSLVPVDPAGENRRKKAGGGGSGAMAEACPRGRLGSRSASLVYRKARRSGRLSEAQASSNVDTPNVRRSVLGRVFAPDGFDPVHRIAAARKSTRTASAAVGGTGRHGRNHDRPPPFTRPQFATRATRLLTPSRHFAPAPFDAQRLSFAKRGPVLQVSMRLERGHHLSHRSNVGREGGVLSENSARRLSRGPP